MRKWVLTIHQPNPGTSETELKIFKHFSRSSKPSPNLSITYLELCVRFQPNLYLKLGI